jgi:multidrug transporter EmrE-like cation transporter
MRWVVLGFGALLAFVDVLMQPIAKLVSTNSLSLVWMGLPTLAYAANPWIFLQSLRFEGIALMNLVWNLMSNVIITFVGLVLFKEQMTSLKWIGVVLSFVAMVCLTAE